MAQKDLIFQYQKLMKFHKRTQFFIAIAIVLIALTFWNGGNKNSAAQLLSSKEHIARIYVTGMLTTNPEAMENLQKIADNDKIKAVIFRLNSPGGTVAGSEQYYNAVAAIARAKPVVVVIEDLATSGGYMMASAADYIVAGNMSVTGSIGVLFQFSEITELAKKLGVNLESIKTSPLKAAPNPFEKLDAKARIVLQNVIDDLYQSFIEIVQKQRNFDSSTVKKLADGRIFTGRQALEVGLIDSVGSEQQALDWLYENKEISDSLEIKEHNLESSKGRFINMLSMMRTLVTHLSIMGFVA